MTTPEAAWVPKAFVRSPQGSRLLRRTRLDSNTLRLTHRSKERVKSSSRLEAHHRQGVGLDLGGRFGSGLHTPKKNSGCRTFTL